MLRQERRRGIQCFEVGGDIVDCGYVDVIGDEGAAQTENGNEAEQRIEQGWQWRAKMHAGLKPESPRRYYARFTQRRAGSKIRE